MSQIIGLITARGGSKTIPRKNIKLLAGKPLIAWTIEAALHSKTLERVIVSTDDEEIAQVSKEWGAEVPFMRPTDLAQDNSPHVAVVEHAIAWLEANDGKEIGAIMLLQPTSPLRTQQDISAVAQLSHELNAKAIVSVCEAATHPYIAKRILEDGTLMDFVSSDIGYLRRQALPSAYALNGAIYLIERDLFLSNKTFTPKGLTHPYIMPQERSIDIDTPFDWRLVEFLLQEQHDS
jgi:N-acylneuraminate cytidylyltransferase/CMP-N,N'-diacetyllegionaminic acid synthase